MEDTAGVPITVEPVTEGKDTSHMENNGKQDVTGDAKETSKIVEEPMEEKSKPGESVPSADSSVVDASTEKAQTEKIPIYHHMSRCERQSFFEEV